MHVRRKYIDRLSIKHSELFQNILYKTLRNKKNIEHKKNKFV